MNPTDYLALLILEQPEEGLLQEFSRLYPHGTYQIGIFERSSSDIPDIDVPKIFVRPKAPLLHQITEGRTSFSVNLISSGSDKSNDMAARLITHPHITNLSWIGYQTYLTPPELLAQLYTRNFSALRLGSYRENCQRAEPLIRNNHLSFIDLSAIRHSDAPDGLGMGPNGLYAEEVCQLAHYVGVSTHPNECYIYGYPRKIKQSQLITILLAQILWHLFEGLSLGQNEDPSQQNQKMLFTAKEVYMGDHDHVLHFLHSNQTGRWWIKLELEEGSHYYVPCMYEEYTSALKGELPITWLRYFQKNNPLL